MHPNEKGSTMHLKIKPLSIAILAALAIANGTAHAQQEQWLRLGGARLIGTSTEAMIPADSTRGTVCAIRLQSTLPLDVQGIAIHFSNHQSMQLSLQDRINAEGFSRVVALPGTRRRVQSISLIYTRPTSPNAVPEIQIWGNPLPGMNYCTR
jgi:hypothetical protein